MMNPLKSIFGKKPQQNIAPTPKPEIKIEEKIEEKKEEVYAPKSMKKVTRGPGGKFVSKDKTVKKEVQESKITEVAKITSVDKKEEQKIPNYQTLTFYGKNMRKIYRNGNWHFLLKDILYVAAIADPEAITEKIKVDSSAKKTTENSIEQIEFMDQNNKKVMDCVTYEGFLTILPILRENGNMPGPFVDWLRDISKLSQN